MIRAYQGLGDAYQVDAEPGYELALGDATRLLHQPTLVYSTLAANTAPRPAALISDLYQIAPNLLGVLIANPAMPRGRMDVSASAFTSVDRNEGCVDLEPIPPSQVAEPLLVAEILRDIGDWCVALDILQPFGKAHLLAWTMLSAVENGEQIREEWFAEPTPLYLPPLAPDALSAADDAPIGRIELEFRVDKKGMADKIDVVTSIPEGLLDHAARQSLRQARFRPSIEDGRFVSARAAIAFEVRYRPE